MSGLQDDLLTLAIKIENGTASAAEISVVKKAVEDLGDSSEKLGANFAKPIEHVGLHLLSHELAGAAGMAGQARSAFMLLNAASAGIGGEAMAVIGPLALAVGAAAVAYELLSKNTEKSKKAAEEELQAQKDLVIQYRETITTLNAAGVATGALHDALQKGLGAATSQTTHDLGKAMGELEKQILKNKIALAQMGEDLKTAAGSGVATGAALRKAADDIRTLNTTLVENQTKLAVMKADLPAIAHGHESAAAAAKEHKEALDRLTSAIDDSDKGFEEWDKKQDEMIKKSEQVGLAITKEIDTFNQKMKDLADIGAEATRSEYAKKKATIQKFNDDQLRSIQELHDRAIAAGMSVSEADQQSTLLKTQLSKTVAEKEKENYTAIEQAGRTAFANIEQASAVALARIIQGHTNLRQQVQLVETQMVQDALVGGIKIVEDAAVSEAKRLILGEETDGGLATSAAAAAQAQVAANAEVTASIHVQTAAVVALGVALKEATADAIALEIALAAVAA
jgi:hypothetical protein